MDVEALRPHLLGAGLDVGRGPIVVEQFPGGHSNLTYLIRAGEREIVLRRPPRGAAIRTAHDMGREFRILSGLWPVYPRVPRPLFYCEDPSVLGAPFYGMDRVKGVILRGSRPPRGLRLSADVMRRLSLALVDTLVELHAVNVSAAGLALEGRGEGYVERQVRGWTERYLRAQTDPVPEVEPVAGWLAQTLPADGPARLVHGDFKHDNLVLDPADPARILAVLDWEMATLGDPLMDLGTSLGYWLDPADPDEHKALPFGPTLLDGNLGRREVADRDAARSGRDVSNILFYYVFGVFKILVIAQQIYRRYRDGFSRDPRFAAMIDGVRILSRAAGRAVERGRIHDLGS